MPRLVRRTWQLDGERRSRAGLALDRDRSAQRLDDLLDDPETEADAAVVTAGRGPLEAPDDGGGRVNVQRGADARGLVGETRADLADDLGQIDDLDVQFEAPGGDARHVEQLVDEAMQAGCLRIDLFDLRDQPWGCVVGGGAPRDAG